MTPEPDIDLEHSCPFVGTDFDRTVHFGYPTHENLCFALTRAEGIEIEHQDTFCLTREHVRCPLYVKAAPSRTRAAVLAKRTTPANLRRSPRCAMCCWARS